MDDLRLQKTAITGSTLSSIIQRFSSAPSDVDGLLFGNVSTFTPSDLPNDDAASPISPKVATVTNFFCSGTTSSFYDPLGHLKPNALAKLIDSGGSHSQSNLVGWFIGRRRTVLRPSMRERSVTASLAAKFPNCPLIFVIFTMSPSDGFIHTHDYRAFQFCRSSGRFEPRSMGIVNVGPAFRPHYDEFKVNSSFFPVLPCGGYGFGTEMELDEREGEKIMEGFDVAKLRQLVGPAATDYTGALEEMYGKMIVKLQNLAKLVEESSALVLEQEARNAKLRHKVMGLE